MQLKFWAMDESRVAVNAGTAEVYAASNATPGGSPITSASSNADGMVTFTGLTGQADDIKFDKGGKGFWLKGFGEWILSRLYLTTGLIHIDQGSDPAAPGAGENIIYAKGGALWQRSGAAGVAGPIVVNGLQTATGNMGVGAVPLSYEGLLIQPTLSAASALAAGVVANPALNATANNDVLAALYTAGVFSSQSKTGVTAAGLYVGPVSNTAPGQLANAFGIYINAPSGASGVNEALHAAGQVTVTGGLGVGIANPASTGINVFGVAPVGLINGIGIGSVVAGTASAGGSGAAPAQVLGYLVWTLAGTGTIKIPYYSN